MQLRFVVFFHRFSQHFPVCLFVAISQRLRHPQDVCTNLLPLDRVLYFLHGIHLHNFREIGRVVLVELAEPRVVVEKLIKLFSLGIPVSPWKYDRQFFLEVVQNDEILYIRGLFHIKVIVGYSCIG